MTFGTLPLTPELPSIAMGFVELPVIVEGSSTAPSLSEWSHSNLRAPSRKPTWTFNGAQFWEQRSTVWTRIVKLVHTVVV